jgi:adenosylcobinamide kinase/adenosylcobinamide-phosphate guanylyltransferase
VTALVIGGSASGKSEFAERLVTRYPAPRFYVATMEPFGAAAEARIARHRVLRAERGFVTIEQYTSLAELRLPARGSVLLECLGNLAANEIFSPSGVGISAELAADAIVQGVISLAAQCDNLVLVGNDVFADGLRYEFETVRYAEILGAATRALAAFCGEAFEVVCGIPLRLK